VSEAKYILSFKVSFRRACKIFGGRTVNGLSPARFFRRLTAAGGLAALEGPL
jgi:hypothetical protein